MTERREQLAQCLEGGCQYSVSVAKACCRSGTSLRLGFETTVVPSYLLSA